MELVILTSTLGLQFINQIHKTYSKNKMYFAYLFSHMKNAGWSHTADTKPSFLSTAQSPFIPLAIASLLLGFPSGLTYIVPFFFNAT
jgi:hypothetical protein